MPSSQSDHGQGHTQSHGHSHSHGHGKSHRGFAAMDADKQREIARKGGESQGKENNPGNFANDRAKASAAGRKGGESRSHSR